MQLFYEKKLKKSGKMLTSTFKDELNQVLAKHRHSLADFDYASILVESVEAYNRKAEKNSHLARQLRKTLETFLILNVAIFLNHAEYKKFLKMLNQNGITGNSFLGKAVKLIPSRLLELRILIYMIGKGRTKYLAKHYRLFENNFIHPFVLMVKKAVSERSFKPFLIMFPRHLWIQAIQIVITTKCTLRCKYCSNLIPLCQKPRDLDRDMIFESLDKMQKYFDSIGTLIFTGGEPFLNPNLKYFIKMVSLDVCKKIEIVTNGTILPNDPELIAIMKEKHVLVTFSNYGTLSYKLKEATEYLTKQGITCNVNSRFDQWRDFGGVDIIEKNEDDLRHQFLRCGGTLPYLINGKFYTCVKSAFGDYMGFIQTFDDEKADILFEGKRDFIRSVKRMMHRNKALNACRYCNSRTKNMAYVPKAEQIKKS